MVPSGWDVKQLSDLATVTSGGTPSRSKLNYWDGDVPWVRTTEVQNCHIFPNDVREFISSEGLKNSSAKLFPAGTILLAMIGQGKTRGQVGLLKFEAATNQNCAAIILGEEQFSEFHFNYLLSQYQNIRNLSNSAGQSNLSGALVKSIRVPVPPYSEQKKIAEILSTWDKAITATEQLLANSQKQKKALMQQLLTGKVRLLDDNGNRFEGDWKEYQINDLVKDVKRPVVWDDEDEYRLLSVKRRSEGVVLREVLQGSQILTKKMKVASQGDFLISKMQVVHGASGLVSKEFDGCHISGSYICLIPKNTDVLNMNFFAWFSKQKIMYHKAFLCSYGVHIEKMTFNFGMFLKEKITIPLLVKEQEKIAEILTSADEEINQLIKKIYLLKQEKKALMQQLLTGKRRVKA